MATRRTLGVWLEGVHVADLIQRRPWDIRCVYTQEARELWPGNAPVLSCSLPLSSRAQDASAFCAGLLPEGQNRLALASIAGVAGNDTFGLLARFGRDVAGAVVIAAEEPEPRTWAVEPYAGESLEEEVLALPERPLGIHDDSELSLAGLQDKLLLVDLGQGKWGRPVHGRPSTHILKVDDRRHAGLVEAERNCLLLARALDLTTIDATLLVVAGIPCLIVSRFDRLVGADGFVRRVHQEDACQALVRDPEANNHLGKYERAGGPGFRDVAELLDRYASDGPEQLDRLVAVATFQVLIGNADAHGKNVALLHPSAERIELAPLYDTVPTVLWPNLRTALAMSVNGRSDIDAITPADVADEAARWPHDRRRALGVVRATAQRCLDAVAAGAVPVDSAVGRLVVERSERFLAG